MIAWFGSRNHTCRELLLHECYVSVLSCHVLTDPPGPIDNSNILFMKGNTRVLRSSKYNNQATICYKFPWDLQYAITQIFDLQIHFISGYFLLSLFFSSYISTLLILVKTYYWFLSYLFLYTYSHRLFIKKILIPCREHLFWV